MIAPTPRLNFEPIGPHHASLFHGLNADPQVMRYFPAPLSAGETDAFIARIVAHRARHGFGLEAAFLAATHTFAGFIGLLRAEFDAPFTPAVEVGWRFAPEFWGKGWHLKAHTRRWQVGLKNWGSARLCLSRHARTRLLFA